MSIFEEYVKDLNFFTEDIRNNLAVLKTGENFDALSDTIRAVFDQANELVKQAEVEARSYESKERRVLNDRIKEFKDQLFALKTEFDAEQFQNERSKLFGKSGEDRGRMLETNEK
jgi:hypothetical protein